jgi:hypothetical protein
MNKQSLRVEQLLQFDNDYYYFMLSSSSSSSTLSILFTRVLMQSQVFIDIKSTTGPSWMFLASFDIEMEITLSCSVKRKKSRTFIQFMVRTLVYINWCCQWYGLCMWCYYNSNTFQKLHICISSWKCLSKDALTNYKKNCKELCKAYSSEIRIAHRMKAQSKIERKYDLKETSYIMKFFIRWSIEM